MALADRLGLAGVILTLFALAAPYLWPDKKWIGWVSVFCALTLLITWGWMEFGATLPRLNLRYPVMSRVVVFIVGGCLALALWTLIQLRSKLEPVKVAIYPAQKNDPPASQTILAPNLLVRYSMDNLPIPIARKETAYVLPLNPKLVFGELEIPNRKRKPISWPSDVPRGKDTVPDIIYVCEITNPDAARTLLDIAITFEISFYAVQENPVIYKNDHGKQSMTFDVQKKMPPGESMRSAYAIKRPGKPAEAFKQGPLSSTLQRTAHIPRINPGETMKVYLINQSRFITKFSLPTEATVVPPEGKRVGATLIRPQVIALDQFPFWELLPPSYHWKGVPDAP
jgi:hypothetical protein